MDAGLIGAWGTAIAGVIGSVGIVLKIVLTRPRVPVAEEVLERVATLEDYLLEMAAWAHSVRMIAARAGLTLPHPPPDPAERRRPPHMTPHLGERTDTGPLPAQRIGARTDG